MAVEMAISVVTIGVISLLVLWLIMQPQKRVLQIAVPLCLVGFSVIYVFYLLALMKPDDPPFGIPAAFAAFVETFLSFTNGVAYADIAESPMTAALAGTLWFETVFWALHMLAIFTLAVSGFAVFGRKLMDRSRLRLTELAGRRPVYHLFGDTAGALMLGENIAREPDRPLVVFYSDHYHEELREDIAAFGGALIETSDASRERWLQRAARRAPGRVVRFGEGGVDRVNGTLVAELLARKTVLDHPPFRGALPPEGGFPAFPYQAVVVGLGTVGRALAARLIESAQFSCEGSRPRLWIIDRDPVALERFQVENPHLGACAEIEYVAADAFSFGARDALEAACGGPGPLHQVFVTCTSLAALAAPDGSPADRDGEVAAHLRGILARTGAFTAEGLADLVVCPAASYDEIWTPAIILHHALDARAIALNGMYCLTAQDRLMPEADRRAKERGAWDAATEFNRESSRASCDFMDAMFALAGVDAAAGDAAERFARAIGDGALLDRLARVEHERWCAFHFCRGFAPMGPDELEARARAWDEDRRAGRPRAGKPPLDPLARRHGCLVGWDELPALEPLYALFDEKIASGEATLQGRDADNVRTFAAIAAASGPGAAPAPGPGAAPAPRKA